MKGVDFDALLVEAELERPLQGIGCFDLGGPEQFLAG